MRSEQFEDGHRSAPTTQPPANTQVARPQLPAEGGDLDTHRFRGSSNAEIAPIEHEDVVKYYGFENWLEDTVQIDLGGRVIEAIAVPRHLHDHLLFDDANTGLAFSGDFLLPGGLLIDDIDAYRASADRAVAYLCGICSCSRPL